MQVLLPLVLLAQQGGWSGSQAPASEPVEQADNAEQAAIAKALRKHSRDIKRCYNKALRRNPDTHGRVEMAWTVEDGGVTNARVRSNTTDDAELGRCISEKMADWTFPPELSGDIIYPFILTSWTPGPLPTASSSETG